MSLPQTQPNLFAVERQNPARMRTQHAYLCLQSDGPAQHHRQIIQQRLLLRLCWQSLSWLHCCLCWEGC